MGAATEFDSAEAFYADRPERQLRGEADYGSHWHNGRFSFPMWRVSYIETTGEVYAVRGDNGPVKLLGQLDPDPEGCYYATLDKVLNGWAGQPVMRLSWVKARLNDRARIEHARDPRPTPATADAHVHPFQGIGGGWTHPDPAQVCPTTAHRHKQKHTAQSCEYNSQLIAWKRRKSARQEASR